MSEKRFLLDKVEKGNAILSVRITDSVSNDNYFIMTKEAYEDDIDEIVDLVNEQQELIEEKNNVITLMGAFIKSKGFSVDDFNEWISKDWYNAEGYGE